MKKIVLGLMCLVSLGFSENIREKSYKLLSTNTIYQIDKSKEVCLEIKEGSEYYYTVLNSWKTGKLSGFGKTLKGDFIQVTVSHNEEGNGKYLFLSGLVRYGAFMINNKHVCDEFANNKPFINKIENMLTSKWGEKTTLYNPPEQLK